MPWRWLAGTLAGMDAPPPAWTQACEDRDFVEWHGGLPWCAVWVVMLEDAALAGRMAQARQALGDWLLPRYARQPHISVAFRGLMGAAHHPRTQMHATQLQRDIACLQQLKVPPWHVTVAGVDSFSTVPYLAVPADAHLAQLHAALEHPAPGAPRPYVPHVTLGHYAVRRPFNAAVGALERALHGSPALMLPVTQLSLVRYRSADIAGPLAVEGVFDLAQQRYVPSPQALLSLV
jgi:2'-5' RNA ligase